MCNFADDNTIYSCSDSFESVASNLGGDMFQAMSLFKRNQMVANPSKFQVMLIGLKANDSVGRNIGGVFIAVVNSVKLLGVTIDSKRKFDQHMEKFMSRSKQ